MDTVLYIFVIIGLMITCFLLGCTSCFIGMLFYRRYVVLKTKEDEFEYDE